MELLDKILLITVFGLQMSLLIFLRRLPVFRLYLAFATVAYVLWFLADRSAVSNGAHWWLPISAWLVAGFRIAIATEAALLVVRCLPYKALIGQGAFCFLAALTACLAMWKAVPSAYPDYPHLAYFLRLYSACFSFVAVLVARLGCWSDSDPCPLMDKRHATILIFYFGGILLSEQTHWAAYKPLVHCFLMVDHLGCMIAWGFMILGERESRRSVLI